MRVQTPYELELARLRLERLRLEEAHLLQVSRLAELERTRAPQANWYEMRGPRSWYEMRKNTQLLRVGSRGARSPQHDPTRVPSAAFVGGSLTQPGLENLHSLRAFREELQHEARRFHDQFTAYTLVD